MSEIRATDTFTAIIAEQRVGLLSVRLGNKTYRIQVLPEELGLLDWGGLRELKLTDVLTYEGVASEKDFILAQQESKRKRKPIEQVLREFGLVEEELLPAIEARILIEAVYELLIEGEAGIFEANDGTPPAEPQVVIEICELLEFITRVEEDAQVFAGHAEMSSIIGLSEEIDEICKNHEIIGHASTVGRLVDGRRNVDAIVKDSRLPAHHVLRTLNGFFEVGVARKFAFSDIQQQAHNEEQKGHYDDAYALYQAAHRLRTGDVGVLEKLTRIAELVEDKPGIAHYNDGLAQRHVASHNEPGAVKCFERVIRFDPHHQQAHEYLFKHAVRQDLQGAMIKIGRDLIRIHIEHKEFDPAKKVATRCLSVAPEDIRLLDALAKTYVTCGEPAEAVDVYEKMMRLHEKKGEKQDAMNLLLILRRLAPEREDFTKKIESVHSEERRRSRIKLIGLAGTPVLLICLAGFLVHHTSVERAAQARQAIMDQHREESHSKDINELEALLTTMSSYQREHPDDSGITDLITELNMRVFDVEEEIQIEEQDASREASRLYDEAIEAQIGPPVRLDLAQELFDQALALVPASHKELRQEILLGLGDLKQAVGEADERAVARTVERIDNALAEGDLRRAHDQLELLETYVGRSEVARVAFRARGDTIARSESTILRAAMAKARDRQAGGFLEEANELLAELKASTDDPEIHTECDKRMSQIQRGLVEAADLLQASELAIQMRDNALAVSTLQRLYKNFGNTQIAAKIKLPVEVNCNLETANITGADGQTHRSVPMPYTVRLGLEEVVIIEVSQAGFEPFEMELRASFENHIRYADMKRAPAWVYTIDGSLAQRPVLLGDSVLLATSKSSLHLVDLESGELKWDEAYPLGGITGFGSEPIVAGTVVVVPTTARKLLGISLETGQKLWEVPGGRAFRGAPALDADGKTVYVGCDDGLVYAIDVASGTELRTGSVGASVCGKLLYHGGRLYFGAEDDKLYALDAGTLREVWEFDTGSDILTRPIFHDGHLIFASRDTKVYAVDLEGEESWSTSVAGAVVGDMALANGSVFAATIGVEAVVQQLRASGGAPVATTPVVGRISGGVAVIGRKLYFGSEDSYIRCFKVALPMELSWELKVGGRITTAPAISSGMVIIGTAGNRVYAFARSE